MASTFSQTLRLELIGDGDQSGIWGQTTNTNLGTLLEQAITGVVNITMTDANYTLTNFNGVSDEARNAVLVVGGTNNAVRDIIAPLVKKLYVVKNSTVGGYAVIIRGSSGASVSVPNGATVWVYCDGTNFNAINTETVGNFEVNGNLTVTGDSSVAGNSSVTGNVAVTGNTSITGNTSVTGNVSAANFTGAGATITSINASNVTSGTLAVAVGGTGVSTSTGTGSVVLSASPALTGTPTAPTAIAGTNTTQIATTAYVLANGIPSGGIIMWSGSIASIPSGWSLCDGTNGTPDLRNRFIVGAGSTYAVAATGGSADATLVSHTHTFSGTTTGQSTGHTHSITDPGHSHTYSAGVSGGTLVDKADNASNSLTFSTNSATTGITGTNNVSNDHTHNYSGTTSTSGSSATNANLPPYYALAYIMKL